MTKTGWWVVKFDIALEGESIRFEDLDECSQEHILECIKDGCRQGEVVMETDTTDEEDDDCVPERIFCEDSLLDACIALNIANIDYDIDSGNRIISNDMQEVIRVLEEEGIDFECI